MGSAVWLLWATPEWFFEAALAPFRGGLLTEIPAFGVLCLLAGVGLAIVQRHWKVIWFGLSLLLSTTLVVVAGFERGKLAGAAESSVELGFLALQLAGCGFLIWRLKGARWAAALLGVFCFCYALFAYFVGAMSFTDNWL